MSAATPRFTFGQAAVALAIGAFLVTFLVVPVLMVIYIAFTNPDGSLTLAHFQGFFQLSLMRESFYNSLYVAVMTAAPS